MERRYRNMLKGAGSILDIIPKRCYPGLEAFRPLSAEEIMAASWQRAGDSIRSAINTYKNDSPKQGSC